MITFNRIDITEREAIDKALDYFKTIAPGPVLMGEPADEVRESLAKLLVMSRGTRYMVDGKLYDHKDSDYSSEGTFGPFYVFDQVRQENESGPWDTRELAQRRVDELNAEHA